MCLIWMCLISRVCLSHVLPNIRPGEGRAIHDRRRIAQAGTGRSSPRYCTASATWAASILKVARTIADLAGADAIAIEHLSEAVQYRTLDRQAA